MQVNSYIEFTKLMNRAIRQTYFAAFDLGFLRQKEQATGIVFDNHVLDTMLLSMHLDLLAHDHTLDAVAERAGVVIHDRHSALGDTMATAAVFAAMLRRLAADGITTLAQALVITRRIDDALESSRQHRF